MARKETYKIQGIKTRTIIGKKIPNTWQHLEQKSESKLSFIFFRDHATP